MPLTREFKEIVQARLQSDRKYRKELLREGVECLQCASGLPGTNNASNHGRAATA